VGGALQSQPGSGQQLLADQRYLELVVDPSARQQAYRALLHNLLDEKLLARIRKSTNACGVIGDNRFKEQIEAMLGRAVPTDKRGRPRLGN
jgi:putative transposase